MSRRRVLVLFGGISTEHGVSVVSAKGVIGALDPARNEVIAAGITRSGEWRHIADLGTLEAGSDGLPVVSGTDGEPAALVRSPDGPLFRSEDPSAIDVVFPVLHGTGGEDGAIQGFLETIGVPYVGSGVAASALGMAKHLSKPVLEAAGVDVTPWTSVNIHQVRADLEAVVDGVVARFALPVFVKPSAQGSSVGVHKARDLSELAKAIEDAVSYDGTALVEEAIEGNEVEVSILGNSDPEASVVGEIIPCNEFYDFEAKYLASGSELVIPARLAPGVEQRIQAMAVTAYRALGCKGLARVDFFVSGDRVLCNEINTMPGFTPISMYPKLWEASGLAYPDLLERLIELALEPHG
jgi:D-alanine-D-alanine ligase